MTRGAGTDANPRDGDRVRIEVDVLNGVVSVVKAEASGCDSLGLMVRTLETLAHRKTEDQVWLLDVGAIAKEMGAVTEENERCALTAIGALRSALVDAHVRARAKGESRT
jgi:hypothetical protein